MTTSKPDFQFSPSNFHRPELKAEPFIIPGEDFWSRQANAQTVSFDFAPFGIPAKITANRPEILAAAHLSAGRFSQATLSNSWPIQIQMVVGSDPGRPLPDDWPQRLVYSGVGEWITLSAGEWGHGFANLSTRTAVIFLAPALAAQTRLVSRYFIDHYLLNFILTEWAMLHASGVFDAERQRLIVMIAPHNVGKSTTALRLLRAGYSFLADGMVLLRHTPAGFSLGGYPIGEVKLRDDVLALFPEYTGEPVRVRELHKTVVNLRLVHANQLIEQLVRPASIQLCFVERADVARSRASKLSPNEVLPRLAANSVYWDEASRLAHNSATLNALLRAASLHLLKLGTEPEEIVTAIDKLR